MPNVKARIQLKHAPEADWSLATNFTPLESELIVYDPDDTYDYPRFKLGDGITNVNDLPFLLNNGDTEELKDIPIIAGDGFLIETIEVEGKNCTLINHYNSENVKKLSLSQYEHVIYIPLIENLFLTGQRVLFGSHTTNYDNEVTYIKNGIYASLSEFEDGRGWNQYQVLTLLVKGSGIEGEFEYIRLLDIPYPAAENVVITPVAETVAF